MAVTRRRALLQHCHKVGKEEEEEESLLEGRVNCFSSSTFNHVYFAQLPFLFYVLDRVENTNTADMSQGIEWTPALVHCAHTCVRAGKHAQNVFKRVESSSSRHTGHWVLAKCAVFNLLFCLWWNPLQATDLLISNFRGSGMVGKLLFPFCKQEKALKNNLLRLLWAVERFFKISVWMKFKWISKKQIKLPQS